MKTIKLAAALALTMLSSCSTVQDAAPGISQPEMDALVSTYYWKPEFSVPQYDRSTLEALIDHSVDPDLDGERGEGHATSLILALASTGDDFFSSVLATRTKEVQKSSEHFVSTAWTFSKLEYPKTQAIYQSNKEAEQVGAGDAEEAV